MDGNPCGEHLTEKNPRATVTGPRQRHAGRLGPRPPLCSESYEEGRAVARVPPPLPRQRRPRHRRLHPLCVRLHAPLHLPRRRPPSPAHDTRAPLPARSAGRLRVGPFQRGGGWRAARARPAVGDGAEGEREGRGAGSAGKGELGAAAGAEREGTVDSRVVARARGAGGAVDGPLQVRLDVGRAELAAGRAGRRRRVVVPCGTTVSDD